MYITVNFLKYGTLDNFKEIVANYMRCYKIKNHLKEH